jgi:hypothetical protein
MKQKNKLQNEKIVLETFKSIGSYEIMNLTKNEPSCFNGLVSIKKYRITIEQINESNEVLAERLQKLWDECNNHHHVQPLRNAAESIGYIFINIYGTKAKR